MQKTNAELAEIVEASWPERTKRKMRDNEWERVLTKVGKEKKGLPLKNGLFVLTKSNFYDQIISKTRMEERIRDRGEE